MCTDDYEFLDCACDCVFHLLYSHAHTHTPKQNWNRDTLRRFGHWDIHSPTSWLEDLFFWDSCSSVWLQVIKKLNFTYLLLLFSVLLLFLQLSGISVSRKWNINCQKKAIHWDRNWMELSSMWIYWCWSPLKKKFKLKVTTDPYRVI